MSQAKLPSWRPGATRDALEIFLDTAEMLPIEQRVAVFDIDGTLWSEKPQYLMIEFLLAELREAVATRPELAERPEYRAALDWDRKAIGQLGPVNVVLALVELHTGITPEEFERRVRAYFATARHAERGVPISQTRYRPMLELIGELRARHFSVYVVTGSGTEFVRAVSYEFFGVKPEGVVGSQVGYELDRSSGSPRLLRTRELLGDPNEGAAKISNIQRLLGRRPILAAGNSAGDAEMLEYARAFDGPSLALLIDHDDSEREAAYGSVAATFAASEPITTTARRHGWTVASMRDDWATVFADS
jgi:phosphoserine phosphatase